MNFNINKKNLFSSKRNKKQGKKQISENKFSNLTIYVYVQMESGTEYHYVWFLVGSVGVRVEEFEINLIDVSRFLFRFFSTK